MRLTVGDEGGDEAGNSSCDVGCEERKATTDPLDGEKYEEGSGELHQSRDEEISVDIPFCDPHPHDQTLINHSTGEPEELKKTYSLSAANTSCPFYVGLTS